MYTRHAHLEGLGAGDWLKGSRDVRSQGRVREEEAFKAHLGISEERKGMFGPDALSSHQISEIGDH